MSISDKMQKFVFSSRIHKYKNIFYNLKKEEKIPFHKKLSDSFMPENFEKKFNGYGERR